MNPDHTGKVALIVEGSTDHDLLRTLLVPNGRYTLVDAGSKQTALEVAAIVRSREIPVLAIVDADDDIITGVNSTPDASVVKTDLRDIEAMIFMSSTGDRFISTYFNHRKVFEFEREFKVKLKNHLCRTLAFIGAARVVNAQSDLGLPFRRVDFCEFVDSTTVTLDRENYLARLCELTNRSVDKDWVLAQSREIVSQHPAELLVPGHDAVKLLSHLCVGHFNAYSAPDAREIERMFRMAYKEEDFRQTRLCSEIRAWGESYQVALVA